MGCSQFLATSICRHMSSVFLYRRGRLVAYFNFVFQLRLFSAYPNIRVVTITEGWDGNDMKLTQRRRYFVNVLSLSSRRMPTQVKSSPFFSQKKKNDNDFAGYYNILRNYTAQSLYFHYHFRMRYECLAFCPST